MPDVPHERAEVGTDNRWWLPWLPRTEVLRHLRSIWEYQVAQTNAATVALERMRREFMAQDRELYAAVIAGLQALGPAVDTLASDRDQWKERALSAEGREATDEADDVAAAAPAKDLVDALLAKVTPAAPDVAEQPAPSPEDATEVVNAAPDPAPADEA